MIKEKTLSSAVETRATEFSSCIKQAMERLRKAGSFEQGLSMVLLKNNNTCVYTKMQIQRVVVKINYLNKF